MHAHVSSVTARATVSAAERLERAGAGLIRWSLVFLLVFFGALEWTAFDDAGCGR